MVLIWLFPFAAFVGLILLGRQPLVAGLMGTAAAALVTWYSGPSHGDLPRILDAFLGGTWIALPAVLVILAGLAFANSIERPVRQDQLEERSASRVAEICLLTGPFMETATGFGVGYVVAMLGLRRLGLGNSHALALAAFSQSLVPWGALGIGTRISAAIAGVELAELGWRIAIIVALLWLALVPLFWRIAESAGFKPSRAEHIEWILLFALLMLLLIGANMVLPIELAALAALGTVMAIRFLRSHGLGGLDRSLLLRLLPFLLLIAALAATQMWPSLRAALSSPIWRPFESVPALAPLLSPAIPMLAIALVFAMVRGGKGILALLSTTALRGWRASLLTFLLVGMAWIMVRGGIAASLMKVADDELGLWAAGVVPLAGAAGGYLTGSNTGAGALSMPLANALSLTVDARFLLISAAITAGSLMTAISPIRAAMGVALVNASLAETRAALGLLGPFAMVVIGLTMIIGIAASIAL
jgi:lactate permease